MKLYFLYQGNFFPPPPPLLPSVKAEGQGFLGTELAGVADWGISDKENWLLLFVYTALRETGLSVQVLMVFFLKINKITPRSSLINITNFSSQQWQPATP